VRRRSSPYPNHYSPAFAFSTILYPHFRQLLLRSACPRHNCRRGRKYGLTQFHSSNTNRLGPASPPVALRVDVSLYQKETTGHLPFGSGVLRCFRPALITVFISSSLALTVLSSLAPCPFATNERIPIPRRTGISMDEALSGRFARDRYQSRTAHRLRLVE
jgi:hypothetical protein